MQVLIQTDFASAVAEALRSFNIVAQPTPVPEDLGSTLPIVVVYNLGGMRHSLVLDDAPIHLDCYATTPGQAFAGAAKAGAVVNALQGQTVGGVHWKVVDIVNGAYDNPDPDHPIPRATCVLNVTARAKLIDI